MKQIRLTQGKFAIVDDEDFDALNAYKWFAVGGGPGFRAGRNITVAPNKQARIYMHRELLPGAYLVDHINRNPLDNRKCNLRAVTPQQNCSNRSKSPGRATSQYRGVTRKRTRWEANIRVRGQLIYLGQFKHEVDAARAYDAAAKTCFGEFANLNFKE